ncbi:competence type IV pilus ATPase ComGA [Aciduricibacillus chroicocephali]|uniref:Competence type IV pilus ATPase ComGA n=1 Tax=Aciduricibacillus chroicocephali TaxID=3054939 RepID=A0ABY9KTG4_9BACI|nr:competence type IV pilus ATPase ComGA [Bacillaceae bacterium 44XB]
MNDASSFAEKILEAAISQHASDIHFHPNPKSSETNIHFRIHGERQHYAVIANDQYQKLLTYYKFTSEMDIGEVRKPQNGTLEIFDPISKQPYSLRLSTLPVMRNESLAIRLLPQEKLHSLDQLFLFPSQLAKITKWMSYRSGLILFTGPTGSGKTTTMYALLEHHIKKHPYQVITLEDPIEKNIEGVLQVQLNEKAGITYQSGLKAALRHDPDIIMVGEIRDAATAKFAFEASLTGHLVLGTLHARDAVGTIKRLREMGIRQSDLEQSLICVAALDLLRLDILNDKAQRAAIMELLYDEQLRDAIWEIPLTHYLNVDFNHLRKKAFAYGFINEKIYKETEKK